MRRGNEEVCVLEIVRPGMEDFESAEKQENTGIGPASARRVMCAGRSASKTRVNALMTRASILFAKRILRRWMDCIATRACPSCAVLCAASRASPTCGVKPGNDSEGVVPAKAGTHDHRRWLWVPALAALGRGSAGTTAGSVSSTNLRLCEMAVGAISIVSD